VDLVNSDVALMYTPLVLLPDMSFHGLFQEVKYTLTPCVNTFIVLKYVLNYIGTAFKPALH